MTMNMFAGLTILIASITTWIQYTIYILYIYPSMLLADMFSIGCSSARHLGDGEHAVEGRLCAQREHHGAPTVVEEAVRRAVGEALALTGDLCECGKGGGRRVAAGEHLLVLAGELL